ncbi:MAG: zinc-binding dehydrogenase [Methanobrevibacter sp.]|jgi:threonine dehydrogenase-like Zn-dependent dehydrogenase|nr:zinc-binding dehydrogenase [Candidatus Methanoflexus mossambicus]
MVEKIKAVGLNDKGELGVKYVEKPPMGSDEVLVRPTAVAPCTSDIHAFFGEDTITEDLGKLVLGHEAIGVIVEAGEDVKDFKVGDKVVIPCTTPDWNCEAAQLGCHINATADDGYDMYVQDMLTGIKYPNTKMGVFCELINVSQADLNLAHHPEDVSVESALMVTDMVTTGFTGAENAKIETGDTVAVLGIGPVGLMAVAGAAIMGAGRIFAVGSRPICTELAREYGATDIIDYHDGDTIQQILEATDMKGVDATIIAGGNNDIFIDAMNITRPSGNISNINMISKGDTIPLPVDAFAFGLADKTIRSSLCLGGRRRAEQLLKMVKYGRVDPSKLITHKFHGFEAIVDALLMMKDKPRDLVKPIVYLD